MEHLTYNPDPRTFRAEVRIATIERLEIPNWTVHEKLYEGCAVVAPQIPWLGHDHADSSYFKDTNTPIVPIDAFNNFYGADWDVDDAFATNDMRKAHPSFADTAISNDDVAYHTTAYIQSWLYLGLLESICMRPVSTSYVVRPDSSGGRWIHSRNLPVLLETWARGLQKHDNLIQETVLNNARECVGVASKILEDVVSKARSSQSAVISRISSLIEPIVPALTLLFEALTRWINFQLRIDIKIWNYVSGGMTESCVEKLVEKGWCRFVVSNAKVALTFSLLHSIDATGIMAASKGHQKCSASKCERNHIIRETYAQKHTPPKCRCRFLKPDLKLVLEILEAGYFPVILFDPDRDKIELGGVHPLDATKDYIAISHVWADGLGSSTERGLPRCQIRRLHRLTASAIPQSPAFWVDALCVPKQEPYCGLAIQMMKSTYQNAMGTIVLDDGLSGLSVRSSNLEIGWCLYASGWFGRLWTYQEGYVSQWVRFVVSDGLINLFTFVRDFYHTSSKLEANKLPELFSRDLISVLQKARPISAPSQVRSKRKRIVDLFNALSRRDSSRPSDQLLVMGLLLDIDIRQLLEIDDEELKWRTFYLSLQQIPWTVVFDTRPKMTSVPFRWAPATWISLGTDEWLHYDESLADITEQGLKTDLTILHLSEQRSTQFKSLYVVTDEHTYRLSRPATANSPALDSFDIVVVRHFESESPHTSLFRNETVLMRVGLGLMNTTSRELDQYDFKDYFIDFSVDYHDALDDKVDTVHGSWEQVSIRFT